MQAAKAWGLTPDRWYSESRESRAVMFEFERAQGDITDYVTKLCTIRR